MYQINDNSHLFLASIDADNEDNEMEEESLEESAEYIISG